MNGGNRQFAYIDPSGEWVRLKTPITSNEQMQACRSKIPHIAEYESVYAWTGWKGGTLTSEISKTAIIDGIFLDLDDENDPQKAVRDAAEIAWYVGHSTNSFSGKKGAHVLISCFPVDLISDLKSHVITRFVNNLADMCCEITTLDSSVIGDTSRVKRITDSKHPGSGLYAIGLTAEELATLTIEEIYEMAKRKRDLVQRPTPSMWVTSQLYKIEDEILTERMTELYERNQISHTSYHTGLKRRKRTTFTDRIGMYNEIKALEDEWHRIQAKNTPRVETTNKWLAEAEETLLTSGQLTNGRDRGEEHKARVHFCKYAHECGRTFRQICGAFINIVDRNGKRCYDKKTTEEQVRSCIGR